MIEPDASAATYLWAAEVLTGGAIDLGVPPAFTQPDAKAPCADRAVPAPAGGDRRLADAGCGADPGGAGRVQRRRRCASSASPTSGSRNATASRALATELSRIRPGLGREEGDDLIVASDPALAGQALPTRIETYADHRIAMSFALAGLKIGGITILDPGCVAKTYPGFWDALASLGVTYDEVA